MFDQSVSPPFRSADLKGRPGSRRLGRRFALLVLMAALIVGAPAWGVERAAEMLPPSTVFYAEISDPPRVLDFVMTHPVTAHVQSMAAYQQAVEGAKYRKFLVALRYVEAQLGNGWQESLRQVTQDGVVLAFDAQTEGVALLAHAADESQLKQFQETFVRLAREDAQRKGEDVPFEEQDYRGITIYRTDEGGFATSGRWLVVVNKRELGRDLLDALLDGRDSSLADQANFQQTQRDVAAGSLGWAYANVGAVREAGAAPKLFSGKADDPIGELLLGGVLEVLQHTPRVSAVLRGERLRITLTVAIPLDRSWITEERSHYFGPGGTGQAPAVGAVPNLLFTLAAYRNLSEMWLRSGDLFNENVNDKMAEADGKLSTLFAGKDFGDDILGSLSPQLQIVVARQEFPAEHPVPAIKLPAVALVAELQDADVTAREFRRIFQSLIGFANVVGAMNGNPQLELDTESLEAGELISATFVPEAGGSETEAKIQYSFSPSIVFPHRRMVIASTAQLARDLAASKWGTPQSGGDVVNLRAELSTDVVRAVLGDNLSHLVSQNMLEKGHSHDEATAEITAFLDILALFQNVSLTLSTNDHALNLNLEVNFADQASPR